MSSLWDFLPFVAMVMVECLDVGLTTLSKAAMSRGMSHFVFVFYSNALASLILLPSSFIFQRTMRPPLTFSLLCRFFILGLTGITLTQNCVFTGISYSSPTLGSAMSNLIPAFTFILAVLFRMEKLDFKNSRSLVKLMGTLVSISGAMIITFYKGPAIGFTSQNLTVQSHPTNSLTASNWVLGGLFLAIADLSLSIWNIFQAATIKKCPAEMLVVSFYVFFGAIQCGVVSLVAERDPNAWKLRPDMELIAIVYSAVFGSVLTPCIFTWCINKKGPLFVALFKPIGIAVAAIMGAMFLGDILHIGSVIGAIIIIVGFYGVIWAQSKEEKQVKEDREVGILRSSTQKIPLLQNHIR